MNLEAGESMADEKVSAISDEKFLENRIIFMQGDFDEKSCNKLARELLYLSVKDEKKDVTIYIDSFGGAAYGLLNILNIIDAAPYKVTTIAMGKAMSAGAYLLLYGDTRLAYRNTRIMLHELMYRTGFAKLHDQTADYKESNELQKIMSKIVAKRTKIKNVDEFLKVDQFMDAATAKKLGVIDSIR